LTTTFVSAVRELGRSPSVVYPRFVPLVHGAAQVVDARRVARHVRAARSAWVVAAAAPYGYGAARSGRPYAAWVATSLAAEWSARRGGLPHRQRLSLAINAPLLRRLERDVLAGAARLFATSAATAASLPAPAEVLPVPVDTAEFVPAPEERWLAGLERPTLVFVGRAADPRKNVALLLHAFAEIRRRVPSARLRLVGGPPVGRVPAGVEVVGTVGSVASELRNATIFILPSYQEGFGIVVAEALAAGVPVVVTPSGGPEEIVRSSGAGRVLAGFHAHELADAVVDLLADPASLAAMRRRGREYAEREYAPERLRAVVASVLRELDDV